MYDRATTKTDVNKARKQLFAQKGKPVDAIPSSKVALSEQMTRPVNFGVKCSLQVQHCQVQRNGDDPEGRRMATVLVNATRM